MPSAALEPKRQVKKVFQFNLWITTKIVWNRKAFMNWSTRWKRGTACPIIVYICYLSHSGMHTNFVILCMSLVANKIYVLDNDYSIGFYVLCLACVRIVCLCPSRLAIHKCVFSIRICKNIYFISVTRIIKCCIVVSHCAECANNFKFATWGALMNEKQKKNYEVNIASFNVMIFQLNKVKLLRIRQQWTIPTRMKNEVWRFLQYHTVNISLCMVESGKCNVLRMDPIHLALHTSHTL